MGRAFFRLFFDAWQFRIFGRLEILKCKSVGTLDMDMLSEESANLAILRSMDRSENYDLLKSMANSWWQDKGDPQVLPLLMIGQLLTGGHKAARETLDTLAAHHRDLSVDSLCDLARGYLIMGRHKDAEGELHKVLNNSPRHLVALLQMGVCLVQQRDLQRARPYLSSAWDRFRDSGDFFPAVHHYVDCLIDNNEAARAGDVLDTAFEGLSKDASDEEVLGRRWDLLCSAQFRVWLAQEAYADAEGWLESQRQRYDDGKIDKDTYIRWLIYYAQQLAAGDRHDHAGEVLGSLGKDFAQDQNLAACRAEIAQVQGQLVAAVRHIRAALDADQQNLALWVRLAQLSLRQFPVQAREAANKIGTLLEADDKPAARVLTLARTVMAQVELEYGDEQTGSAALEAILDEFPKFIPALMALGHFRLQQGRIEEAIGLFDTIKALDPAQGYSALMSARQFPDDPAVLEELEGVAQRPSIAGPERAALQFHLAGAWEKQGEYTRAFELVDKANRANRGKLRYDARQHRQRCARIRYAFGRSLYEHRKDCGHPSKLPVFVVGMPRSGTTLVEQILSGHSQIFGAGELGQIPQVVQGINRWERQIGSARHYPDCIDDLTPKVVEGVAENLLKALREFDQQAQHVVDKLPHNFENIGLIKFLFPNAKVISVRRDSRDIAISNYFTDYQAKNGGMGFAYDLEEIGEQLADHNLLMHHWHQVFPGEILEMHYEDLVADIEVGAKTMLDYIGVAWEPQVLDFSEVERSVKTASVWQVRQPLYTSSMDRWQRYQNFLGPLIRGTNKSIEVHEPIKMITLPEPGFLTNGIEAYQEGDLDAAELSFKKMLHHNPAHAACEFMVGLIYVRKNHLKDGISYMEAAIKRAPWQRRWKEDLCRAYRLAGEDAKANALSDTLKGPPVGEPDGEDAVQATGDFTG